MLTLPRAAGRFDSDTVIGESGGQLGKTGQDRPVTLEFAATPAAIRQALGEVRDALGETGIAPDLLSRIELVLGEVFNNIAEHSYSAAQGGCVRLALWRQGRAIRTRIADKGCPLPGREPPEGTLPETDVPRDRLPEGGFGWFLIHSQSDEIRYRREPGENILELDFRPRPGR